MPKVRPAWLIPIVVTIVVAAVPVLRLHAGLQWGLPPAVPAFGAGASFDRIVSAFLTAADDDPVARWAEPYFDHARDFVEQRYPDDPDMLLAAATLAAPDGDDQLALLQRAVDAGGGPAAWAAYCEVVSSSGPSYERFGNWGVDPTDPVDVAQAERTLAQGDRPTQLEPNAVAPILDALHVWQTTDPENGLPHALEAWYLYGLHRDADTLVSWEEAGRLPTVSLRSAGSTRSLARLFQRMGMPEPEALLLSQIGAGFGSLAKLRSCARIANYEGGLAVMDGRPNDAIRWWHASFGVGEHMAESAETIIEFLVGSAVQGIAAAPIWPWCADSMTGIPDGPLLGGRLFYGDYHDLHVSQVGEEADAQLRDDFIRTKVRTNLMRGAIGGGDGVGDYTRASHPLGVAQLVAAVALCAILLGAAVSAWARRRADQATHIHSLWVFIISGLIFLPIVEFGRYDPEPDSDMVMFSFPLPRESFLVGLVLCVLSAILAPLLAAVFSRAPGARLLSAWRGNLRRILPTTVALAALLYLGLSLAAMEPRADYARKWLSPGITEMDSVRQAFGDEWTNPTIPPDAYRAEYPPPSP